MVGAVLVDALGWIRRSRSGPNPQPKPRLGTGRSARFLRDRVQPARVQRRTNRQIPATAPAFVPGRRMEPALPRPQKAATREAWQRGHCDLILPLQDLIRARPLEVVNRPWRVIFMTFPGFP